MKSKKSFFRTVEPYLYLVPVMILFILFVFWPFVKTIQLSFARTTPLGQVAQYVGLDNYTNIFTDGTFLNSLVTTLKFSVMRVILSIVLGFILAIISTEKIRAKGFFRTVYALPMAISAAAASVVFMFIFHSSLGILYVTVLIISQIIKSKFNCLDDSHFLCPFRVVLRVLVQ